MSDASPLPPNRFVLWPSLIAASSLVLGCIDVEDGIDEDIDEDIDEVVDETSDGSELWATGPIRVAGTSVGTSQNGTVQIRIPSATEAGDLLLLFLHRTDDTNFWS